jgi:ABC-2 type transport system permease protein
MRLFWEVTRVSLQRQLTYRTAAWAGLATNLFFGLLRAALFVALYGEQQEVAGMTVQDVITYTALSQAVIAYLSIFGWYNVMDSVATGEIAADLLRPMNYFRFWVALDFGRAIVAFFLRGVTVMLVYALFVQIVVPSGLVQWLALFVSIILGWFVGFTWHFLVNLSAFWSPNARGIGRLGFSLVWIMSGFYVPLRFFPEWMQTLCHLTPFPALVNTSIEIYLGLLQGSAIFWALLLQLLWAFVLTALCYAVLRAGVRHLVIQGG